MPTSPPYCFQTPPDPSSPLLALIFPQSVGDPSLPFYSSGEDYFTQGPFPVLFLPLKNSSPSSGESGESGYATVSSSPFQKAEGEDENQEFS